MIVVAIERAQSVEEGITKIDEILSAEFGMEKEIVFTPDFLTEEKDPE